MGAGIDETGPPRPLGVGTRYGNTDAIALIFRFGFVGPPATQLSPCFLTEGTAMTTNDTAHKLDSECLDKGTFMTVPTGHMLLDSEKRARMEQIREILRRHNPTLTDEQLDELVIQFWQRSGLGDG
ncbi:hypothetical protein A5739_25795 [Mycobacterium colombiense]|nr:hypothetical protein A5732_04570 [Mycobacterium colombiense]OMC15608.1 hypothetical protein A5737_10680 [Mycobacterium colombiense]OMC37103.1 hypothetical protein A5739_25795 [Mycobacterium colombiense]